MHFSIPKILIPLVTLRLLDPTSARALIPGSGDVACYGESCSSLGRPNHLDIVKPRVAAFLGEEGPPHEGPGSSHPTSSDPTTGQSSGSHPDPITGQSGSGQPSDDHPNPITGQSPESSSGDDSSFSNFDNLQSTAGDPEKVLAYEEYITRGKSVTSGIYNAVANKIPDATKREKGQPEGTAKYVDISDGYKPFGDSSSSDSGGALSDSEGLEPEEEMRQQLQPLFTEPDISLDAQSTYVEQKWASILEPAPGRTAPVPGTNINAPLDGLVHNAYYNKDEGSIVIDYVDSRNDGWPQGDPHKLSMSEITWQTWKEHAGDDKKGNLRVIIRKTVENAGTVKTIEAAYAKNNLDTTKDRGDFSMGSNDAAKHDAFMALLGTDNVRPIEYMLIDHHGEAGDKEIRRILTFPPGYKGTLPSGYWNIVLILDRAI